MSNVNDDPEKLYEDCHDAGGMSKFAWIDDPKRMAFTLARYKHTAKLLEGKSSVLEIGCSDGYASRIVRQHVGSLCAIDIDEKAIAEAQANNSSKWPINFVVDTVDGGVSDYRWDGAYMLDVLEHIPPDQERAFLKQIACIADVLVVGTPSLESQQYASRLSKEGHVNCKTGADLRRILEDYYMHVFMFTMHDTTLDTGFMPMAHYLLALAVEPLAHLRPGSGYSK